MARRHLVRVELVMPDAAGLGVEAIVLLRPSLILWATERAVTLKAKIRGRLSGTGRGKQYGDARRSSAPGESPARQTGAYERSYEHDVKEYKTSIQGRVGTPLWRTQGASLELGNSRMRPRPHVWPAFLQWKRETIRDLERQAQGGFTA